MNHGNIEDGGVRDLGARANFKYPEHVYCLAERSTSVLA
jgi:hypothetical protein